MILLRARAVLLVARVPAVVHTVALLPRRNAPLVVALEPPLKTRPVPTVPRFLVRLVRAVRYTVARHPERHAPAVRAPETVVGVAGLRIVVAPPAVLPQDAALQTQALHDRRRVQRADLLAAAVEVGARVREAVVGVVGYGHDAHRSVDVAPQPDHVLAGEFVGSEDGAQHPVGPVDVVAVDGDGEGVLGGHFGEDDAIGTVVLAALDLVQAGVAPVDLLGFVVEGEGVGHADVGLDDGFAAVACNQRH